MFFVCLSGAEHLKQIAADTIQELLEQWEPQEDEGCIYQQLALHHLRSRAIRAVIGIPFWLKFN